MPVVSIAELKSYFQNGRVPNQSDFEDLIDTLGAEVSIDPVFNTVTISGTDLIHLLLEYDASNQVSVKIDSSGRLTLDPTGDVIYMPAQISGFKAEPVFITDNYTTTDADSGKTIICAGVGTPYTVTIHSTAPVGFSVMIAQVGTSQITVAASGGTLNNRQSHTKTAGQYACVSALVRNNSGSSPIVLLAGDTSS